MKVRLMLLILCLVSFSIDCFSQATVCSYKYRKRITFDPTKVSGPIDLTNFPALVSITSDNDLRTVANSGHVENANGYDIIFTAADGATVLNFQLERYVATSGLFTAWVKVPLLSTSINTYIYMYYGNTAISTDQSSTATWSGYYSVWHFQNNSFSDNSPNAYTLTNNSTTNQSPALINDGRADNGTQWLETSSSFPNLTTNFSISGWVYTTNNATGGQRIFCDDVNNTGGYALSIGDGGTGQLRFYSRSSSVVVLDSPSNTLLSNTWYYCVGVADITNNVRSIYVNGVLAASVTSTGWGTDAGNSSVAGETASGETGNRLNGRIDEVRVANTALSADWILTEYNNQNSPSTFYSISVEPKVWNGGNNTNYNTASNWLNNSAPSSGDDVIINNGTNQPTLQGNEQVNSIFVRTGATLSLSNRQLAVRSDITNCGTISGGTGEVLFNSTSSFAQNQNMSGSGTYNLTNLTVNNTFATSPSLTLSKDVNVSGLLTLTSGIVYTSSTNILALGTTATSTSGSASSFVSGPISKVGATDFVFPTGKGTKWRRTSVTNISASSTFRAEYFNAAYTSTTPVNSPLNNISNVEYWQVDRVVGAGNANLSLYWESANLSGINNCPDLTIARWNGASWDERPGTTTGASSCSGSGTGTVVSTALITAFSPFTFGSKLSTVNPLPVELISFKAECESPGIVLKWSTATETNNDHFTLEQSVDAGTWEELVQVKGAGTSQVQHAYSYAVPLSSDKTMYYRLSQVDRNGIKKSFGVISTDCLPSSDKMLLYPNPASNQITVQFDLVKDYGAGTLKIMDNVGRICLQKTVELLKGNGTQAFYINLEPGSYTVLLSAEQLSLPAQKLIVK